GTNRFTWDLRYAGAHRFEGMILWGARAEQGPLAPPGQYTVRLTANGQTMTQPVVIKKDPRLTDVSDSDLQEQFQLALQVRDRTSEANDMVVQIRALKKEIKDRLDKATSEAIGTSGKALTE